MKKPLNITLVQFSPSWEKQEENYNKVLGLLKKRPPAEGGVICLPELFSTGYTMRPKRFSEDPLSSPTTDFLSKIARLYSCHVIGGLILDSNGGPGNSAVAVSPSGKVLCRYDKMHLLPGSGESKAYSAGDAPALFSIRGKKFGLLICYDLRFPEAFRMLAAQNASGVFLLANWPKKRQSHFEVLTRARAVENQLFIFAVNRKGKDPCASYAGGSRIIDPSGKILASSKTSLAVSFRVNLKDVEQTRKAFPADRSSLFNLYKKFKPYRK